MNQVHRDGNKGIHDEYMGVITYRTQITSAICEYSI